MSQSNETEQKGKGYVRPSEYMRSRRPELFSDTRLEIVTPLSKEFLEYHLDTLTNRKQEQVFEEFCRRLAELEICPNLKPQTGPTGGGDSKVDSSTYPVAKVLTERCYWGNPNPPTDETWGFAFSCKKKWKDKIIEDVEKIAKLERNFTKVHGITNQFVPDKKRAQLESELSVKFHFEVHIYDRSWIVNKVIQNKRENLAIEILGIRVAETNKPHIGPNNTKRIEELENLKSKFLRPEIYNGNDYALAQDYLRAGKLSRGLENPRQEIDGYFLRARELAKKYGSRGQIIRTAYHHAWTCFWWFDDPATVETIYSDIEGFLIGTEDAEDCELFINLWRLLFGAVGRNEISAEKGILKERLSQIKAELNRLIGQTDRPNNSLYAETLLHLLDLPNLLENESKAAEVFSSLKSCLKRSNGLGTYPALQFIRNLNDLGEFLDDLPGYDSLFEEMRKIASKREGEAAEGRLLYERGLQLYQKGKTKDVLRYLGMARTKLAKEETHRENIRIGLACSDAYRNLGLFWAARMEAITSAHLSIRNLTTVYEFPLEAFLAVMRLALLELALGRIVLFIAWYELECVLLEHLKAMQYVTSDFEKDIRLQEGVLGCFFLNMDLEELRDYTDLKNGLDAARLSMARWALLYANGEFDVIMKEAGKEVFNSEETLHADFQAWKSQLAFEQLPKNFPGEARMYCIFQTNMMGVTYKLKAKNDFGPIVFSENLLGIIEAALALAEWKNLAFIVDELNISVETKDFAKNPPSLDFDRRINQTSYSFIWGHDMLGWLNKAERKEVSDYFFKFLLRLLLEITIDPFEDIKQELNKWYKEETFSRALGMSPTSIAINDLIGKERYELNYWYKGTTS